MTTHEKLRISIMSARYLVALERQDDQELAALLALAANDQLLLEAFTEIDAGLIEEHDSRERAVLEVQLAETVEKHLPSAEIVRPASEPVRVADVANELFRHAPDRLPAEAHALNERLRGSKELLPANLGLSKLIAWAEAIFGPAAPEYWKVFQQAAIKLETQRGVSAEYQMAARTAPKPGGKP